MTKVEVLKLIGAAQTLWPGWRNAPSTQDEASMMADVWMHLLADLPNPLVMAALTALAAEGREFVPPVGVMRRHSIMLRARANGALAPGSDEAWGEVRRQIERYGRAGKPSDWAHECILQAVDAVGWYDLCHSMNQEAVRAHFVKFYAESVARFERDLVLSPQMREAITTASLIELTERT